MCPKESNVLSGSERLSRGRFDRAGLYEGGDRESDDFRTLEILWG